MIIGGYRVGPLLKKTASKIGVDQLATLAASAAYSFFFSLFPLLLFLAPLLSLVGDKTRMMSLLMGQLTSVLPPDQLKAVQPLLENIVFATGAPTLMSIGLLLAAWAGSNVFGTLIGSLNNAYEVEESRSWIRQQAIRLATFALAAVIITLTTAIFLGGENIANKVGDALHLSTVFVAVWKIVQIPLAIGGLFALAFVILYALPDINQRKVHVAVGALITTVLWIAATLLFRIYIQHFPPNPTYGLIGGVIILLTWMYYTMFVVLVSGELASQLHHGTGAIAPKSGAVYLGRVVAESERVTQPNA